MLKQRIGFRFNGIEMIPKEVNEIKNSNPPTLEVNYVGKYNGRDISMTLIIFTRDFEDALYNKK